MVACFYKLEVLKHKTFKFFSIIVYYKWGSTPNVLSLRIPDAIGLLRNSNVKKRLKI